MSWRPCTVFFEENRPNNNRNEGKFRRDIVLADRENGQVFNPKFRQIYIELPRFNKEEEECETDLNVGFMY